MAVTCQLRSSDGFHFVSATLAELPNPQHVDHVVPRDVRSLFATGAQVDGQSAMLPGPYSRR